MDLKQLKINAEEDYIITPISVLKYITNLEEKIENQESTDNFIKLVRIWAEEKGIYDTGDLKTQTLKLSEEVGELSKAVIEGGEYEVVDAIGDCMIVLINVAELANIHFMKNGNCIGCECEDQQSCPEITLEFCLKTAYNVIKNRTGKMKNGTFVKDN